MSGNDDGRTFLDDLFDKAEEAIETVERFADGASALPITFADGSRIIADSIAGGPEPAWLVLRFIAPDGASHVRRYVLTKEAPARRMIDVGESE